MSILSFPSLTFLLISIPWSTSPGPHQNSPAQPDFILLWSNQLHLTLPASSTIARPSPCTDLFPHLLFSLTSSTATAWPPRPFSPLKSPWLLTDTQQKNPMTLMASQVRCRPEWGDMAWAVPSWIFLCQTLQLYENPYEQCVWSELQRKEANGNCFCLGLQNRIHE